MKQLFNTKDSINKVGIIATIVAIISVFLPWASVSFLGLAANASFIQGDGIITLIIAVIALLLFICKRDGFASILSIISLIIVLYDITNIMSTYVASLEIGAYLLLLSNIVMIAAPFIKINRK